MHLALHPPAERAGDAEGADLTEANLQELTWEAGTVRAINTLVVRAGPASHIVLLRHAIPVLLDKPASATRETFQ